MNSDTNNSIDVEPVLHELEPAQTGYEDSLEGLLQYHTDRSLWFKEQSKAAKTHVKRDYYHKKLVKNNKNLWKLLVRTPNAYNPLMEILKESEDKVEAENFVRTSGYSQVMDENGEPAAPVTPDYYFDSLSMLTPDESTTAAMTPEQEVRLAKQKALLDDAIVVYGEVLPPRGDA